MRSFTAQVENSIRREILMVRLTGFFGVLALLLAAVGLYGLLAYRLVLGGALRLVAIGVVLGLPAGWWASRHRLWCWPLRH